MLVPSAWITGIRQLLTKIPSSSTAHAPHSPSPQPSLVPVSFNSSRKTSSNLCMGHTSTTWSTPLTCKCTRVLDTGHLHCPHYDFWYCWNAGHLRPNGILNRIDYGRRRAINGQLSNPLRAHRAMWIRIFLEKCTYRREIHCGGDDVVCHLRILHASFVPNHVFVKSIANALHDAAFNLPRGQNWMNHAPYFLHRHKVLHLHFKRQRINTHFGN